MVEMGYNIPARQDQANKHMKESGIQVNIIGAGLAGLSAAITLARAEIPSNLVSLLPSERAQSVLAEGGINGALNTMGEDDCTENHFEDTRKAGVYIADKEAVRGLTVHAPEILQELKLLGVPFNLQNEKIQQRNFGGQKKKRTAYARSSTGKVLMTALIDEARKYEAKGLITRYPHHELMDLCIFPEREKRDPRSLQGQDIWSSGNRKQDPNDHADPQPDKNKTYFQKVYINQFASEKIDDRNQETQEIRHLKTPENETAKMQGRRCKGVWIQDTYTKDMIFLRGTVILATGGMNGMFPEKTTGTVTNSADAAALAFAKGVRFSNLEMIQYHPTTIGIAGKRCLVSEAARGEGGRLFVQRQGIPWYFMEEKYPELGNLMPRDVVSREMYFVSREAGAGENANARDGNRDRFSDLQSDQRQQVWLDLHHLPKETWEKKLPDMRQELMHYLGIDPAKEPVPVEPGIHYFMGGIDVDIHHRTNIDGLYAAGECCSQYHGANRLGGNSTMGAIYGGRVAAEDVAAKLRSESRSASGGAPAWLQGNSQPTIDATSERQQGESREESVDVAAKLQSEGWSALDEASMQLQREDGKPPETKQQCDEAERYDIARECFRKDEQMDVAGADSPRYDQTGECEYITAWETPSSSDLTYKVRDLLLDAMGIIRNEEGLKKSLAQLEQLQAAWEKTGQQSVSQQMNLFNKERSCAEESRQQQDPSDADIGNSLQRDKCRMLLAKAMLESALYRKESRGAHYRSDFPTVNDQYRGMTICEWNSKFQNVEIDFRPCAD